MFSLNGRRYSGGFPIGLSIAYSAVHKSACPEKGVGVNPWVNVYFHDPLGPGSG
jgi:hypothetical protein